MYSKKDQVKKVSRKKLVRELDDLVRKVLKTKEYRCFTCGVKAKDIGWFGEISNGERNYKGLQVGHFRSRRHEANRWNLDNCHLQCGRCNYIHFRDQTAYTIKMIEKNGNGVLQQLLDREKTHIKYKTFQLEEIREELAKSIKDCQHITS